MGLSVTLALYGRGLTCMKQLTYTGRHQTAPPKLHISLCHLTLTGIHFNMALVLWIDKQASFHGSRWTSFICLALHLGSRIDLPCADPGVFSILTGTNLCLTVQQQTSSQHQFISTKVMLAVKTGSEVKL